MQKDLVSIILPTYNREKILPRAINSVRAQTHPSWELIIVDDGSTDNTAGLIASESGGDPRFVYLYKQQDGPARCRNFGLRAARGSFIAFLDSDDEYLPEHLDSRIRYMNEHPEADFLHGGVCVTGGIEQQFVPDKDDPSLFVPLSECVIGGTFFCRSGVIEGAGGWKKGYAEDADLYERVRSFYSIHEVPFETYIYHRDSPDSRVNNAGAS